MTAIGQRPLPFAAAALALYAALLLPLAASRHFDMSVFVNAGQTYVDGSRTAAPIAIIPNSVGYDGQFFYRLAIDPFTLARTAYGVTLDTPAKRAQRMLYPLVSWMVALGRPGLVPLSLVLVNFAGLGATAAAAAWLAKRHGLAAWFPFAVMAWPGELITLTDDTAEIMTGALLLAALACYLERRFVAYAALAAAATLTRETTVPVFAGILLWECYDAARSRAWRARPLLACGLALAPFAVWREIVAFMFQQSSTAASASTDIGWPLLGVSRMLLGNLDGAVTWGSDAQGDFIMRSFVVATTVALLAFCIAVIRRLCVLPPTPRGLAVGWMLVCALMSLLTAKGPWIEPHGYFRAFTECYLLGCLLLASPPAWLAGRSRLAAVVAVLCVVEITAVNWLWCRSLLPTHTV